MLLVLPFPWLFFLLRFGDVMHGAHESDYFEVLFCQNHVAISEF
jgi:hypothetical protein